MPCSPSDLSVKIPNSPSGPAIPGFGIPSAPITPNLSNFIEGFPEDLVFLFEKLQFLLPAGVFKPQLSYNFGKDIFDSIMKILDQVMPFLMLYKFFLPVLNLLICIIEVLCAIPNPVKLIKAMIRLFRKCLPSFLNLFPILALVIMIISLIILLLALVDYIVEQITKFIAILIKNINMFEQASSKADGKVILINLRKIGSLLCIFQNLFVLLSLFNLIIQVFRDMLSLVYSIPPCDDNNGITDGCCTTDVCPAIIKNGNYTRFTGTFKYLNAVYAQNTIPGLPPGVSPEFSKLTVLIRNESWQLFDSKQATYEKFINIIDSYDVPPEVPFLTKPNFFPTDANYSQSTSPKQAAYTVDLRMFYNPANWGRNLPADGYARYIQFKDCIVLFAPTAYYKDYLNTSLSMPSGTFILAGGIGYEDDGTTQLKAYAPDGITKTNNIATINNFLHQADLNSSSPVLLSTDGYLFNNVEYTFKPNVNVLLNKNLITAGCIPNLSLNKAFINQAFAGDIGVKLNLLQNLLNSTNAPDDSNVKFPDTNKAQECLSAALSAFRSNVTIDGATEMQTTMLLCLQKLKDDALKALENLIGIGFDPCKSSLEGTPKIQFTSNPIKISVDLKESNGVSLISGLSSSVALNIASRIKAYPTFGTVSNFNYDGYQFFTANLTSINTGSGKLMVSFDNQIFCENIIPSDIDIPPSRILKEFDYQFIYTPVGFTVPIAPTAEGNPSDGASPRRDSNDLSIENNGTKDGT